MALVEYWIMRRPKNPFSNLVMYSTDSTQAQALFYHTPLVPPAGVHTYEDTTVVQAVKGQAWLLHSIHGSIQDAVASLKLVVSYMGSENTKILKVINHELELVLK